MLERLIGRVTNRLLTRLPGPGMDVPAHTPVVSFTFDDVPDSAFLEGAKILEAHDGRGTFYIAGGILGREEESRRLINAKGCAELAARGHELGCHTFSHINLQKTPRQALAKDLDRSAKALGDIVPGYVPRNFAAPYNAGAFRHRPELARRFRSARGGMPGINRGRTDRTFLRSYPLQQPEQSVAGMHVLIDELVAKPGWLIFFGHDVSDRPTPFGCTPQSLAALVAHAQNSGCAILTINQALDRFEAAA
ncbi:MAG: polysaccharide deacetylase family protein [Devosia sp.]|uniref:polysaccharide deacetylase family protein n=1 Tax=unclassified Devosia TaxID=196773 RepID=UPI0019EE55EC|nr:MULTISPECIES: polysaccharide deacetylase family protein [unclassified Devosia]MBF0679013.1 polysaccharide deacetylase family protein [Devosia sp.]WEJ33627.1 polysaccharide deacetylase family protein [Devosia sp. SD17-2]